MGSGLGPEKKRGGAATSARTTLQTFPPSPPATRQAGAGRTPQAAHVWLMPAKTGRGAAAPRLCHHRALGGWGKLRARTRPPSRLHPAAGHRDRLPLCPLQLKAGVKRTRCLHLARPSPGPQDPAAAAAGWTLTGSWPRIDQHSLLPSSGPRGPGESRGRLDSPRSSSVRVPAAAAGHRALPCGIHLCLSHQSVHSHRSLPDPRRRPAGCLENTGRQPCRTDRKQAKPPGKPPPQRPPSAPLRRLSRRHCSRSLALLRAPVTTTSYSTGDHVPAPGRLQECRPCPPGRPANDTDFYDDVTGGSEKQRPLRQLRESGGAIRSTSQTQKCG